MYRYRKRDAILVIVTAVITLAWCRVIYGPSSPSPNVAIHGLTPLQAGAAQADNHAGVISIAELFASSRANDPILHILTTKAFSSGNVWDAQVIPFFHKRSGVFREKDDVTLFTWVTVERLPRLAELAEARRGGYLVVKTSRR
jgi:predicted lipoprotein